MKNTLHLNLKRRRFYDIAVGAKQIEYRARTRYWKNRLEDRDYDVIKFRNGYAANAPEMLVKFRGLRKRRRKYEILLGRVLQVKRWKPPRPSKNQLARARAYIDSMDWRFGRSWPQWPHWYVVRKRSTAREFDSIASLIERFGYSDRWNTRTSYYLVIGKFKYWVIDNVLNRAAPLSNVEFKKRGARYATRHGKKIGPYGRLVSLNKRKR